MSEEVEVVPVKPNLAKTPVRLETSKDADVQEVLGRRKPSGLRSATTQEETKAGENKAKSSSSKIPWLTIIFGIIIIVLIIAVIYYVLKYNSQLEANQKELESISEHKEYLNNLQQQLMYKMTMLSDPKESISQEISSGNVDVLPQPVEARPAAPQAPIKMPPTKNEMDDVLNKLDLDEAAKKETNDVQGHVSMVVGTFEIEPSTSKAKIEEIPDDSEDQDDTMMRQHMLNSGMNEEDVIEGLTQNMIESDEE